MKRVQKKVTKMEDMKILLSEWGLSEYYTSFEANKITLPILAMLDSGMVKELISPIGDRARFLKNLDNWKKINNTDEETMSNASSYTIPLDDDGFVDILNPSHRKVVSISEFLLPSKESNTSQGSSKQIKENTSEVVMVHDDTKTQDIENETSAVIIIDHADQNQSTSGLTNSSQIIVDENEDFSCSLPLRSLLMKSNEGQGLLNLYLEEGKLTNNGRRKLCNIIIKDLMKNNAEKKIDSSILLKRAQEITEVFKKENVSTYFIPYINDNKLKIKRCAKGKLYDCLQNRRRELREAKVIKKKNNNSSLSDTASDEQPEADNCNEEDIQWLQNCIEPWHTVEEKWRRTTKFRLNEIKSGNMSIDGYMTKYPALKTTRGHELLIADFDYMYPSSANKINETFEGVKPKLFKMALTKCHIAEVKEILEQYQLMKKDEENSEEAESILAFMLLPLLLGNPSHKVKKQVWRPSKAEVKDGFITYVARAMDMKDTMEKRREKYLKMNLTFQPTVVIVGPSYTNIEKYYVNVNETYFETQTIMKSVETCFKVYHALHCQYPVESTCVWTFVQIGLYQLKTKWDKQYSTVNAFITDLGIEINRNK